MGQGAQVSCTATIFYMHTLAYVALIPTQICPIFILMKIYCMCAYNIWCHKNGLCRRTSPRPSHVLAHHPNRQLPLVLRAMHEMENGCLPRLLPSVSGLHTKMHVRAQWQLQLLHCSCNGIHVLMHQYPAYYRVILSYRAAIGTCKWVYGYASWEHQAAHLG